MPVTKLLMGLGMATLMLGTVASTAGAVTNLVSNGSFENGVDPGVLTTLHPGDTNITAWNVTTGEVDYKGTYWPAADGSRSVDLNGFQPGAISQTVPTTVGAVYQVTFYLSGNPDSVPVTNSWWSPSLKHMMLTASGAPFQVYSYDTSVKGNSLTDMKWEEQTYKFKATVPSTTLTFASQIVGAFGPAIDNVVMTQWLPTSADQCKKDGWKDFGVFKNQGDCVSFVSTGGSNPPANQ